MKNAPKPEQGIFHVIKEELEKDADRSVEGMDKQRWLLYGILLIIVIVAVILLI